MARSGTDVSAAMKSLTARTTAAMAQSADTAAGHHGVVMRAPESIGILLFLGAASRRPPLPVFASGREARHGLIRPACTRQCIATPFVRSGHAAMYQFHAGLSDASAIHRHGTAPITRTTASSRLKSLHRVRRSPSVRRGAFESTCRPARCARSRRDGRIRSREGSGISICPANTGW